MQPKSQNTMESLESLAASALNEFTSHSEIRGASYTAMQGLLKRLVQKDRIAVVTDAEAAMIIEVSNREVAIAKEKSGSCAVGNALGALVGQLYLEGRVGQNAGQRSR